MTRIAPPALLLTLGLAACELHLSVPDIGIGLDGVDPAGAFVDEEDTGLEDTDDTDVVDDTCDDLEEEVEACWDEAEDEDDETCTELEEIWESLCG